MRVFFFFPVKVAVVIVIGELLICWRLNPAFFDPSAIENVYLPAFRFWTDLPESLSDTAPDGATVPASVPRNGATADPTTSVELALPEFPLEIGVLDLPLEPPADPEFAVPTRAVFDVTNVKTAEGLKSSFHV